LNTPSIAVIGTGSLACIFAARLSAVANVQMIGSWRSQIDAINNTGLTVHEIDGSCNVVQVEALDSVDDNPAYKADFVIVLVKSFQTAQALERVKSVAGPHSCVLTLQNGLGNIEQIKRVVPDRYVTAGTTLQAANISDVANVRHAGNGVTVVDDVPRLKTLIRCLQQASIPVESPRLAGADSIAQVIWRKLIINSAVNPLTALLGRPNGFLADNAQARLLSEATAVETLQVAVHEQIWNSSADIDAQHLVTEAARVTAENRSSMLQDISRGSRTEIEAMCGEVVAHASRHGQPAPLNQLWLKLIKEVEGKSFSAGDQLKFDTARLLGLAGLEG
jgi:2-dehydropantoate 2-reductase